MSEAKTYSGGCHCGAVRWEVTTALGQGITCNCSICQKTGTVLTFVPAGAFRLDRGEENLTDYLFNKRSIHHLFCKTCGIRSFARGALPDGSPMVAVNLRCIDDIDLAAVPTQQFDGKSM